MSEIRVILEMSVVIAFIGAVGFYIGAMVISHPLDKALKDCAKQHNVYACEIVYQPVKEIE